MKGVEVGVDFHLGTDDVLEVLALVERATAHDGVSPLSEHVLMHLRHGGDERGVHLRAHISGELVGYAHLDTTDSVEGSSGEVVVAPDQRRRGIGHDLVQQLVELSPDGRLRLWAHGGRADAAHLARSLGFEQARVLWQMRRSLLASLPSVSWPQDIVVRSFQPGVDDDAWVALNAQAFADLPDQGGWTADDLRRRMRESWFDEQGFFLAESTRPGEEGTLAGFHWTKVHGRDAHGHEPMGEVYVVGVAPQWRGTGLGRALVLAGLAHLRRAGLPQAMLYVDASNTAAIRLYESLGFTRWDTDTLYRR
jgi:mycothiol synthase